jgi:hypothetical protein
MEVRYQLRHSPATRSGTALGNSGILANRVGGCEIGSRAQCYRPRPEETVSGSSMSGQSRHSRSSA